MNTLQTLEMALEALESCGEDEWHTEDDFGMAQIYDEEKVIKAIIALRQQIALEKKAENERELGIQMQPDEPVAWATREDFYRELDRSVNRMRQQMEIKAVLMRCKNYDLALPIIDIREGHVLVGQVTQPKREWVGLTLEDKQEYAAQDYGGSQIGRAHV